jgi:hypothetical protein
MKITTLIPAYKVKYLVELLASLLHQTLKSNKVIFSDDSPDGAFTAQLLAEPVRSLIEQLNVTVIKGPRRGAYANAAHLLEVWGGETELVHILCDDDIIYPHFYERHLQAHISGYFSSTVSRRWYANEKGQPIAHGLPVPELISNHQSRYISIDAPVVFSTTVGKASNWLGEVSNVVMRSETAKYISARHHDGISFAGLEDLGPFILGTLHDPLCFINEHLGFFRQSPEQNSSQTMGIPLKFAHLAYIALAFIGRNTGVLTEEQLNYNLEVVGGAVMWNYRAEEDMISFRALMPSLIAREENSEKHFLEMWNNYIRVSESN